MVPVGARGAGQQSTQTSDSKTIYPTLAARKLHQTGGKKAAGDRRWKRVDVLLAGNPRHPHLPESSCVEGRASVVVLREGRQRRRAAAPARAAAPEVRVTLHRT